MNSHGYSVYLTFFNNVLLSNSNIIFCDKLLKILNFLNCL